MRSILNALQDGRLFELPEAGKERALEFLARILDANPDIEVGTDAIEEIKRRENECNTGIGLGVAVPHVRAKREEGDLFCAIGWSAQGIDYGASDHERVHLVFMYYIPAAQKNVYLKEISSLVKAIKQTGGIGPIVHAVDLNAVRNLLLDWVSEVLAASGPEAVARMIKLEVKQAQAPLATPALGAVGIPAHLPVQVPVQVPLSPTPALAIGTPSHRALLVEILIAPPLAPLVLAADGEWAALAEKDSSLPQRLATGSAFTLAGRSLLVLESTAFPGGRVRYQCVGLPPAA